MFWKTRNSHILLMTVLTGTTFQRQRAEWLATRVQRQVDGRGVWGRRDTCTCVAEYLCCPPETIPTLDYESESVVSCVLLFATLWTVACQAPLSMGFSRQEYQRIPSLGDLLDTGIKPGSPALQTDSLPSDLNPTSVFFYLLVV